MTAAEALADLGPPRSTTDARRTIVAAIDAAATRLNNTRAVCRKSYVNPRVLDSYTAGTLEDAFRRARRREYLRRSKAAVLLIVADAGLSRPVASVRSVSEL